MTKTAALSIATGKAVFQWEEWALFMRPSKQMFRGVLGLACSVEWGGSVSYPSAISLFHLCSACQHSATLRQGQNPHSGPSRGKRKANARPGMPKRSVVAGQPAGLIGVYLTRLTRRQRLSVLFASFREDHIGIHVLLPQFLALILHSDGDLFPMVFIIFY